MRSFFSIHRQGMLRVASCTPRIHVGDPRSNCEETLALMRKGEERGVDLLLFPELGLSAYAIDDLLLQEALLDGVETALRTLAKVSEDMRQVCIVGAPIRRNQRLYNCGVAIHRGRILGVVPKSFLPNYREFYENRWFSHGADLEGLDVEVAGQLVPFGTDLLFGASDLADFVFHIEVCEDFWTPIPPSARGALAGALILCNLSASNVVIGKAQDRAMLCASQSVRCHAAYLYSASGPGESTTDLAWDGQATIHELGVQLAATQRFPREAQMAVADLDLERIRQERMRTTSFGASAAQAGHPESSFRVVRFDFEPRFGEDVGLERRIDRFPFVPDDPARLDHDCYEAFNIQVQGLMKRMQATRTERVVIGVSGGLDSTHALLVAVRTFDAMGLPRENILGFTMPGFATSESTKSNAWKLMRALGVSAEEIDIRPVAMKMLEDLRHPFARGERVFDVTFENVQAGLRTDYLFRLANQRSAFVLGTGDLSELALGWCTYGVGDHMSHYNVNGGVAKTLIQYLVRWVATSGQIDPQAAETLHAVLGTEISPELVPAEAGKVQSTESAVGPYELQDFNLFYVARFGLRPSKIAFLAWHAWRDASVGEWPPAFPANTRRAYQLADVKRWLEVFLHRFFETSQFKRSALPNGPKVVAGGSLSPRGDWRAPSDGNARAWLQELRENVPGDDHQAPHNAASPGAATP